MAIANVLIQNLPLSACEGTNNDSKMSVVTNDAIEKLMEKLFLVVILWSSGSINSSNNSNNSYSKNDNKIALSMQRVALTWLMEKR